MQKILIIGNGFLGSAFANFSLDNFQLKIVGHNDLDIKDISQVRKMFKEQNPSIVINTSAMAKVEDCEKNYIEAMNVNALSVLNIAKASSKIGAKLIQISTDYVFDGKKNFYIETDRPNPINIYGISKYSGELFASNYNKSYYIVRTSCLFGDSPSNKTDFIDLMLQFAKEKKYIEVVNDIIMSPTNVDSLVVKIFELIDKNVPSGIYHLTNQGSCSWYDLAKKTFSILGIDYDLRPVKAELQIALASKPKNTELRSVELEKNGINPMSNWEDDLQKYLNNKLNETKNSL